MAVTFPGISHTACASGSLSQESERKPGKAREVEDGKISDVSPKN